jgi:UDP-N-acetylmuramoyl-tripeptide--D-alanyl-D-alanine ligase
MVGPAPGRRRIVSQAAREIWPVVRVLAGTYRRIGMRQCGICAVVGSLGKSTTTRTLRAGLLGHSEGYQGMGNAWGGLVLNMLQWPHGLRRQVLEVGIAGLGQMRQYAWIVQPDVAVVTCVASEHHRSLGALETTRREKSEMVRVLPKSGLAVLNGDDPNVLWMACRTQAQVVTCGFGPDNDFRAEDYRLDWPRGASFAVSTDGWTRRAHVRLIGRQMVFPVLAGLAVARHLGVPLDDALSRMEALGPTRGRMQPVPLPNGAWVLRDDFKSTYETIVSALDTFEQIPARRRFVVMGDVSEPPGSQGPIYREIGARVAGMAARFYVIGNGYQRYAAGAVRAGMPREAIVKADFDLNAVARDLAERLGPGDVVLLKGRDNQQVERVALALRGVDVRCSVTRCPMRGMACENCPALRTGGGYAGLGV